VRCSPQSVSPPQIARGFCRGAAHHEALRRASAPVERLRQWLL
jgi:hypothetical protein